MGVPGRVRAGDANYVRYGLVELGKVRLIGNYKY